MNNRGEEAFEILREAFPDKPMIFGIVQDGEEAEFGMQGNVIELHALLASAVSQLAKKISPNSPEEVIAMFIKSLIAVEVFGDDGTSEETDEDVQEEDGE